MRELYFMPKIINRPLYPGGLPMHFGSGQWAGNVKNKLHIAVCKYYGVYPGGSQELNDEERRLLFEYIVYHINAPMWDAMPGNLEILVQLREQADNIDTLDKLESYLLNAIEAGLDPL